MSDITRRRVRCVLGSAAVLTMLTTTAVAAPTQAAAVRSGGAVVPENQPARTAVLNLMGAQSDSAILPDDFAVAAGYVPMIRDGLLVDPTGGCSSPIPLPADFTVACQAHDLGYDLLRYAYDHGEPLGSWARQAVDATFGHHLRTVCTTRPDTTSRLGCDLMATTADTAVDLNSRRQNYAAPRPESVFGHRLSGKSSGTDLLRLMGLAFAVGALGGGLTLAARRAARRFGGRGGSGDRRPNSLRPGVIAAGAPRSGAAVASRSLVDVARPLPHRLHEPSPAAVRPDSYRPDAGTLFIYRSETTGPDAPWRGANTSVVFRPVATVPGSPVFGPAVAGHDLAR
ncbi:hypothetical protein [Nocardia sp. BMG111209]|uniref:hypothetical protein n=1 Tax=Nocardia sp. BMG111209 TaxID=1160137 RepID=UPI00037E31F9|nr:hypothetical protein [Nocardia sp. BMG111209]